MVILRLLLSLLVWPKVITLSGFSLYYSVRFVKKAYNMLSLTSPIQMSSFPEWLEQFPYYLLIYLFHFVLPLSVHLTFVTLFYVRNAAVFPQLIRELKDMFNL